MPEPEEEEEQLPGREHIHAATHGGPHTRTDGHFLKKSYPMEDPHYSRFFAEDCHPWRGPALEQGKNCEEEGVTEMKHFGLSAIPHSSPSTAWDERAAGRGACNEGVKLSLGKGGIKLV